MNVIKRDGRKVPYDGTKIKEAVRKAYEATGVQVPDLDSLEEVIGRQVFDGIGIEEIQDMVEGWLMQTHPTVARAYILYRDEHQKARWLSPDPDAIANYIHASKYARHVGDRRETFQETVDRVEKFLGTDLSLVRHKMVLPSMRLMQFAGDAVKAHNARAYNCSFTLADRPRVFAEAFYLLLCGCGVGFSVQKCHVEKLPPLVRGELVRFEAVEDTIEGWAESVNILMDSYFSGYYVEFDYSRIRPKGSPLKTSGGRAPGHRPLKLLHEKLRQHLDPICGKKMEPIEVHDVFCFIAEAVLAGGIRRSSLISLFSPDDHEMMFAKHPSRFVHGKKNDQRQMANNSAVLSRDDKKNFDLVMELNSACYGEPGFFFSDHPDYGTNPCGEIGLYPVYEGETGFAFCNLTEVNAAACETEADFIGACRKAAEIGTHQATLTNFKYLTHVSKMIAERDALLGVSITGIWDSGKEWDLELAVQHVRKTNEYWAKKLGINPAKRLTCIKPSGTASLELGCVSSGIHPNHAPRYYRRITANPTEGPAQYFKSINPHMVETKPNGDWSLIFPVVASGRTIQDVTAQEQLDIALHYKRNWVNPGSLEGPSHNVSLTVSFRPEEKEDLIARIWKERQHITAMSFAPIFMDDVPFLPRQEAKDLSRWVDMISKYRPVDWSEFHEEEDGTNFVMEPACAGGVCEIPGIVTEASRGERIIFFDTPVWVDETWKARKAKVGDIIWMDGVHEVLSTGISYQGPFKVVRNVEK